MKKNKLFLYCCILILFISVPHITAQIERCWCEDNGECEAFECKSCIDCDGPGCWCDDNRKCEPGECPECIDCKIERELLEKEALEKEPLIIEKEEEKYIVDNGKIIKIDEKPKVKNPLLILIVILGLIYVGVKVFNKKNVGKLAEDKEKRKLSAIMFTDMKGFSKEVGEDEEGTLKKLWRYEKVMKAIIKEHDGRIVKTIGDAIMGDFDSAVNAVKAALAIQKLLKKEEIMIRIGIHLGDVIHKAGDIFGDGVNIASRIESLCEPGEIYISEEVYKQVRGKISARYENLGKRKLKNIKTDVQVYRIRV